MVDMVYVIQFVGCIFCVIFEIIFKKGWVLVVKLVLNLCKMVEKRMWLIMFFFRQFFSCLGEIVRKVEWIEVFFSSYLDFDFFCMGELFGMFKVGKIVCVFVVKFFCVEVQVNVQFMICFMFWVELIIMFNFEWDVDVYGLFESFWIMVEDCDGEDIFFYDQFIFCKDYVEFDVNEYIVEFIVFIIELMLFNYFILVILDCWMYFEI